MTQFEEPTSQQPTYVNKDNPRSKITCYTSKGSDQSFSAYLQDISESEINYDAIYDAKMDDLNRIEILNNQEGITYGEKDFLLTPGSISKDWKVGNEFVQSCAVDDYPGMESHSLS